MWNGTNGIRQCWTGHLYMVFSTSGSISVHATLQRTSDLGNGWDSRPDSKSKCSIKSSHHYLYSTFYNANCVTAALQPSGHESMVSVSSWSWSIYTRPWLWLADRSLLVSFWTGAHCVHCRSSHDSDVKPDFIHPKGKHIYTDWIT